MRLLFRTVLRHYRRHPWQLILAVFGVALGVATVVAIELAGNSAQRAFQLSLHDIAGAATHRIVGLSQGVDERLYLRLRLSGVRESAPLIEAHVHAQGETLHLLGVDPFAEGQFRRHLRQIDNGLDGALIAEPGSAYLAAPTAARLGVGAGDTLEITLGGKTHRLTLLGLMDGADTGIGAGEGRAAAIDGLLICDIATAQEITGMQGRLSWIDLRLPDGTEGIRRAEFIAGLLPPSVAMLPAAARTRALEQMGAAFHTNLRAMSLLALIVGMFLIFNTMRFAVVQRRDQIACQRLLGVTRGEILAVTLSEALLIGAAGTALGLPAGIALGQTLLTLIAQTVNDLYFVLTVTELWIAPGLLLRGLLLGLAATLLAALVPALEATLVAPRGGLRRSQLETKSRTLAPRLALLGVVALILSAALLGASQDSLHAGFVGLFLVVLGVSLLTPLCTLGLVRLIGSLPAAITVRLAVRGIAAALSRTGVALAALMLTMATTLGLALMIDSFRATVAQWLDASLQADIYVSLPSSAGGTLAPALVEAVLAVPGVAAHSTGRMLQLESADGITAVFVLGLSPGLAPAYPLKNGDAGAVWPRFTAGTAITVSEPFAYRHRLSVNDTLTLRTDHGPHAFPIAGIHYDYRSEQGQVLMPRALYAQWYGDQAVGSIGLYLQDGADREHAMAAVRAAIAGAADGDPVQLRSHAELRRLSMDIFERTFTITEVLRLIAIIVAVAGILGALMAMQLERGAELAVLRMLGCTPLQIFGMVMVQTGTMGLIAGLIALPAGAVLAALLVEVINVRSFGWSMRLLLPPGAFLNALATAFAAALIAGLYPAWKMSRALPATTLRGG